MNKTTPLTGREDVTLVYQHILVYKVSVSCE